MMSANALVRRITSALLLGAAVGAFSSWLIGCVDGSGGPLDPSEPADNAELAALITVTEPVKLPETAPGTERAGAWSDATLQSIDNDSVSFVSFSPGTFPEADSAKIENSRSGAVTGGRIADGGLDPVAIHGSVGDSLLIQVLQASAVAFRIWIVVPERKPPVVVRTRPARGETAVPLNSSIVIVFSEPIDVSTTSSRTLSLQRGGLPVPSELVVESDGLTFGLLPLDPLEPETSYIVLISDELADLSGDRLQQVETVPFTTAPLPEPTAIILSPDSLTLGAGLSVQLAVTDSNGNPVDPSSLVWSSSDSSVVTVSSQGLAAGVSEGAAAITADEGSLAATAEMRVITLPQFVSVSAGASHTCGLTGDGAAWCWGSDEFGQLGSGGVVPIALVPGVVQTDQRYVAISAGGGHTCAAAESGELWCWGRNDFGQIGDGSRVNRSVPVLVSGTAGFATVTAGQDHTCGYSTEGTAYCWGRNTDGQLGDGTQTDRVQPGPVAGNLVVASLSAGVKHTCATTTSRYHYCWGSNASGQLSDPDIGARSLTPHHPGDSGGFFESMVSVSAGKDHTCALQPNGDAWCGGSLVIAALNGGSAPGVVQCRRGDTGEPISCEDVMFGLVPVILYGAVTAGYAHSCSLASNGKTYCWGRDNYGQRGDQSDADWTFDEPPAEPVVGALAFATVDAGAYHTCGITTAGETFCWGRNDTGQIGDATTVNREAPRLVSF